MQVLFSFLGRCYATQVGRRVLLALPLVCGFGGALACADRAPPSGGAVDATGHTSDEDATESEPSTMTTTASDASSTGEATTADSATVGPSESGEPGRDIGGSDVGPSLPDEVRTLWIAAHPDDEVTVAPVLAKRCLGDNLHCTMLVATRGEGSSCPSIGGCPPDLAAVRTMEMVESAAQFKADLIQWDLPDFRSPEPNFVGDVEDHIDQWASVVGSREALLMMLREAISDAAPDEILTMDPRHGTTCHTAHRAIAQLTLEVVLGMADPPTLRFSESGFGGDGATFIGLVAIVDDRVLQRFDATEPVGDGAAWDFFGDTLRIHASQFPAAFGDAADATPPEARQAYEVDLRSYDALSEALENYCYR